MSDDAKKLDPLIDNNLLYLVSLTRVLAEQLKEYDDIIVKGEYDPKEMLVKLSSISHACQQTATNAASVFGVIHTVLLKGRMEEPKDEVFLKDLPVNPNAN